MRIDLVLILLYGICSVRGRICETFDLSRPKRAAAVYKRCERMTDDDDEKLELKRKFVKCWSETAVKNGVTAALRLLKDENVRAIVLETDEWDCIVRHITNAGKDCRSVHFITRIIFLLLIIILILLAWIIHLLKTSGNKNDTCCKSNDPEYQLRLCTSFDSCPGRLNEDSERLLRIQENNKLYLTKSLDRIPKNNNTNTNPSNMDY